MLKRMVAILTVLAVMAAPVLAASAAPPHKNVVETAAAAPQFSTLVSLVKKAGLVKALSGNSKLTVFGPTNAAFAKVPKKTLNGLLEHKQALRKVLLYHVVAGEVPASKVVKLSSAKTLEGARVTFSVKGKSVFVDEAKVIKADIGASNGVIHAIGSVLIPPNL